MCGMAAKFVDRHHSSGLIAFKPDEGLNALQQIISQSNPHLIAANIDWKLFPYSSSFLSTLSPIKSTTTTAIPVLLQLLDGSPSYRKKEIFS